MGIESEKLGYGTYGGKGRAPHRETRRTVRVPNVTRDVAPHVHAFEAGARIQDVTSRAQEHRVRGRVNVEGFNANTHHLHSADWPS
jgi:hypothetical protein